MTTPRKNPSLTTGQVAKVCRVAARTASKWIDSGQLKGYRVPGSPDRRVLYEDLRRFINDHGLPRLGLLEVDPNYRLLVVGMDPDTLEDLRSCFLANKELIVEIESVASAFEAGLLVANFRPDCILVDAAIGHIEAGQIALVMRRSKDYEGTVLIALADPEFIQSKSIWDRVYSLIMGLPWIATQIQSLIARKKDRRFPKRKSPCPRPTVSSASS